MDRLKEGLIPVAQQERPVEALGVLQSHLLPPGIAVLPEGHAPALRVAPAERVDINKEHGVDAAVSHLADLHGQAYYHVEVVHAVLVALQGQRHALTPPRVKERLQSDLVAYKSGVDVQPGVHFLEQVL